MQDVKYILRVRILHNRMGLVSAKPSRMIFLLNGRRRELEPSRLRKYLVNLIYYPSGIVLYHTSRMYKYLTLNTKLMLL
jgi:hypothetical protein